MLTKIEVGTGWRRYKSEQVIRPGEYYRCDVRRPDDVLKKRLGMMAVSDPAGRFMWICPYAAWVKHVIGGLILPELACYNQSDRTDWNLIGIDPARLRPYQRKFIVDGWNTVTNGHNYRRGLIVGLGGGKTLMGLSLCQLGEVSVVAAPRHVHSTWENEAKKWGLRPPILTTYESLHRCPTPDVLIGDEILAVKNADAARSRRFREQSEKAQIVLGMTGTPTSARGPLDWQWLDCVIPGSFPTVDTSVRFLFSDETEMKEVAPGRKAYVTPATSWDTERVARFVEPYLFRVDTSELLKHLPPIEYRQLRVPQPKDWGIISAGGATDGTRSKRVVQMRMASDGYILNDMGQPIELDTNKVDAITEFVESLGEPVVIFATWRESIARLARGLAEYDPAVVAGDTADIGYQLGRFTGGQTNVLIMNVSYGSGVDSLQQRARVAVFMSPPRSPVDRAQAVGRLYRHGQDSGVIVVDVIAEGTMDDRALELVTGHSDLSESMVNKILSEEFGG